MKNLKWCCPQSRGIFTLGSYLVDASPVFSCPLESGAYLPFLMMHGNIHILYVWHRLILLFHLLYIGLDDSLIKHSWGRRTADNLLLRNVNVQFKEYSQLDHQIGAQEVALQVETLSVWLELLPSVSDVLVPRQGLQSEPLLVSVLWSQPSFQAVIPISASNFNILNSRTAGGSPWLDSRHSTKIAKFCRTCSIWFEECRVQLLLSLIYAALICASYWDSCTWFFFAFYTIQILPNFHRLHFVAFTLYCCYDGCFETAELGKQSWSAS